MAKNTKTSSRRPVSGLEAADTGGALAAGSASPPARRARSGGVARDALPGGFPVGGNTALLDVADTVAGKLDAIAPSFGEILKAVGSGVAKAQRALDDSVRDTVKQLSDTKIKVVTDVVQQIDDDTGEPLAPQPEDLITQELSVLNFVTPSVHEWKYVALSMDMSVAGMSEKTGMRFSSASFAASRQSSGLAFGFIGLGSTSVSADFSTVRTNVQREAEWASGQVQLDALLAPRRTNKLPVPATVEKGPQIFVVQGRTTDVKDGAGASAKLVERNVEITVTVLKASGAANSGKNPLIEAPGLLREAVAGGATNTEGKVKYRLRRFFGGSGSGFAQFPVTVRLGGVVRRFNVDL